MIDEVKDDEDVEEAINYSQINPNNPNKKQKVNEIENQIISTIINKEKKERT